MLALIPRPQDAARLTVDHPDAEPTDELHLTLAYLGDDVTGWSADERDTVLARAQQAAGGMAPFEVRVMGHAVFNPDGHDDHDSCAVYLIGDSRELGPLREKLSLLGDAEQHEPFIPHITAGYGVDVTTLTYTGPVVFDRLRGP